MLNTTNSFETIKKVIEEIDVSEKTKERLYSTLEKDIDNFFNNMTIKGKTIEEIITILDGLEMEKNARNTNDNGKFKLLI